MPDELLRSTDSAQLSEILAYQNLIVEEAREAKESANVERQLMQVFGDPAKR